MKLEFTYLAKIYKVIDGDTVDLIVDLGFFTYKIIRTRLRNINSPEIKEESGRIARDALREYLPVGTGIGVTTYKDPTDKYGRWLATLNYNGKDVGEWLIENNYAVKKDYG